ncbi:MAG: hypothetical protein KC478_03350 [Bacteriovoracaceae bacterium]|nr:hypothetical protein [Bacteriovoracaceae bacterium]
MIRTILFSLLLACTTAFAKPNAKVIKRPEMKAYGIVETGTVPESEKLISKLSSQFEKYGDTRELIVSFLDFNPKENKVKIFVGFFEGSRLKDHPKDNYEKLTFPQGPYLQVKFDDPGELRDAYDVINSIEKKMGKKTTGYVINGYTIVDFKYIPTSLVKIQE